MGGEVRVASVPQEDVLAMSISDVEAEKDAREDDAEHGQHGHQNEQTDGNDARRYLLRDRIRRRIIICTFTHRQLRFSAAIF